MAFGAGCCRKFILVRARNDTAWKELFVIEVSAMFCPGRCASVNDTGGIETCYVSLHGQFQIASGEGTHREYSVDDGEVIVWMCTPCGEKYVYDPNAFDTPINLFFSPVINLYSSVALASQLRPRLSPIWQAYRSHSSSSADSLPTLVSAGSAVDMEEIN